MSSTFSNDLRLELIGTGDQAGVWGATTNVNLGTLLEAAIAGNAVVAVTATQQALTINYGLADEARCAVIKLTTALTGAFEVFAPPVPKLYVIYNASSQQATVACWTEASYPGTLTAAGSTVVIPAGKTMTVWSDGTDFRSQNTHLNSPSFTTPALGTPASGNLSNCTSLSLTSGVSGTLPVANGGTGVTTSTGTGSVVLSSSPTLVTPALGTPASGNFSTGTFTWPTFNQNTSGTAAGLSATLVVGSGGTGTTTTPTSGGIAYGASSVYAFTSAGTTGQVLTSAGSGTPTWTSQSSLSVGYASSAGSAGSATSATTATNIAGGAVGGIPYQTASATTSILSAGTSGYWLKANGAAAPSWEQPSNFTAGNVSGTVAIANGGTGGTTASAARSNLGLGTVATINTNASTSNFLRGDGTWVTPTAAVPIDVQTFTSSSTWTAPSGGQTMCMIELWGGGGGGGRGSTSGGGGGGAYVSVIGPITILNSGVTVTVGAGGTGRTGTNGSGTAGGTSSIALNKFTSGLDGVVLYAYGGAGGTTTNGGGGGGMLGAGSSYSGGKGYATDVSLTSSVQGDPTGGGRAGGNISCATSNAQGSMYGGGGGGAYGATTGGSSMYGGGGGTFTGGTAGLSKYGNAGGVGTSSGWSPAGGGGSSSTSGGDGGGGKVVITCW